MVLMDLLYFRHPLLDCGPAVPPGRLRRRLLCGESAADHWRHLLGEFNTLLLLKHPLCLHKDWQLESRVEYIYTIIFVITGFGF